MLNTFLRFVCVLISFSQITAATVPFDTWPDPSDGEACYTWLSAQTTFSQDRLDAWNEHVHEVIQIRFDRVVYPDTLKNLCNAALYFSEQAGNGIFEADMEEAQIRVYNNLAPALLAIEQTDATEENKLKTQSSILVRMAKTHFTSKE